MDAAFASLTPHARSLAKQLAVIVAGGGFGGLTYGLSRYLEEPKEGFVGWTKREALRKGTVFRYSLGQAAVGVGGAFAAVFGVLTVGDAVQGGAAADFAGRLLYLAALSVVGGFIANRLLQSVGAALEARLRANEKEAAQAVETSEKAKEDANRARQDAIEGRKMLYDAIVARGLYQRLEGLETGAGNEELILRAKDTLLKLEGLRNDFPYDRTLFIPLSNLSFELGRVTGDLNLQDNALRFLASFIKRRQDDAIGLNDDDAAAWYNIACFDAIQAKAAGELETGAKTGKALDALRESFRIAKALGSGALQRRLERAQEDTDLQELIQTPPFVALLQTFQASRQESSRQESSRQG